jgi:hypothetical protein
MRFRNPLINNVFFPLAGVVACCYVSLPGFADGSSRDSRDQAISGTNQPAAPADGAEHQTSCSKLRGRASLDIDINLAAPQSGVSSQAIFSTAAMKAIQRGKSVIAICFLCGSEGDLHKIEIPVIEPDSRGGVVFYPLWICTECLDRDEYFTSNSWLVWYIDENNTVQWKKRPPKSCGCKTDGCSCATSGYDCRMNKNSAKNTTRTP